MKKFLLRVFLFFILFGLIDVSCGLAFKLLRDMARAGETLKNEYLSNNCEDDILILGSSRAVHHYVSELFEDSLHMTCYNAGEEGCGIIPAYIRYKQVSERKKPKIVIYEVTPSFDYLKDKDYSAYLGVIRQITDKKNVREEYLKLSDDLECLRLLSNLYRNNSKIIMNLKDALSSPDMNKGYIPLYGRQKQETPKTQIERKTISYDDIDKKKYSIMEQLVIDTQREGVKLIFTISPVWCQADDLHSIDLPEYRIAYDLSKKYNVPLFNNMVCKDLELNSELFQDKVHLNHDGALAYSNYMAKQLAAFMGMK